jgi:hypothetical protein
MDSRALFVSGSDLIAHYTALDSQSSGLTGLTVKFSVYDPSVSRYWDNGTGAFDSVGEVLNTASEVSDGLYQYTLTSGFTSGNSNYRVGVEATESVTGDTADFLVWNDLIAPPGGSSSATATAVWEEVLENSLQAQEIIRLMVSALAGKVSGLDTGSPVFRDLADAKNRISATTDINGNRSSVTIDGS